MIIDHEDSDLFHSKSPYTERMESIEIFGDALSFGMIGGMILLGNLMSQHLGRT